MKRKQKALKEIYAVEAAKILGVAKATVRKMTERGTLVAIRHDGPFNVYSADQVLELKAARKKKRAKKR